MKTLVWATDIHLNFVDRAGIESWCQDVLALRPDVVLLGGDIAEAPSIEGYLSELASKLGRPVYFVLGNHDFYLGSIAGVRARVAKLCRRSPDLFWMNEAGIVALTAQTALIGCDGWGDARLGQGVDSRIALNDFVLIEELTNLTRDAKAERLAALGAEAAAHVRATLPVALETFQHVVFLTHVPPFREACWHEGKITCDEWLPYFTCGAVGDALVETMRRHPEKTMTVLCGHTHGAGVARILPNLTVLTGGAAYGRPTVQAPLRIE